MLESCVCIASPSQIFANRVPSKTVGGQMPLGVGRNVAPWFSSRSIAAESSPSGPICWFCKASALTECHQVVNCARIRAHMPNASRMGRLRGTQKLAYLAKDESVRNRGCGRYPNPGQRHSARLQMIGQHRGRHDYVSLFLNTMRYSLRRALSLDSADSGTHNPTVDGQIEVAAQDGRPIGPPQGAPRHPLEPKC
jgi:hypothetical protein